MGEGGRAGVVTRMFARTNKKRGIVGTSERDVVNCRCMETTVSRDCPATHTARLLSNVSAVNPFSAIDAILESAIFNVNSKMYLISIHFIRRHSEIFVKVTT